MQQPNSSQVSHIWLWEELKWRGIWVPFYDSTECWYFRNIWPWWTTLWSHLSTVFHLWVCVPIIRCQNTTLQISKRKQISEFSFEDGKVIFMSKSEAFFVDLSWIFLKVFCYFIFGLVFPYLLLPITVLARLFHVTNYKIAPLYYKTEIFFFTYCLIYVYCWYAKFYILHYMEEERSYLYCCKIITWKNHYWFESLCML